MSLEWTAGWVFIIEVAVSLQWIYWLDVWIWCYLHCSEDDIILGERLVAYVISYGTLILQYAPVLYGFSSLMFAHSLFLCLLWH